MRTLPLKIVTSLTLISLLVACGKSDSSSSSSSGGSGSSPQEEEMELEVNADGSNIDGIYMAKFETLNPHVNGTLPGSASIHRKGDKIFAYVRLFAGGPQVWHPQNIYTGNRCPTMDDDTNKDGFIDINEANAVLGKVIVPLDADINSQRSGRNFYPLGDLSGNYFYERVGSFNRFWSDLKKEDTEPADNVTKLGPEDGLPIIGQAFLLQGIVQTTELPETVGTTGRFLPQQTLPIACGIFRKVEEEPGQPDDGVIPGPIAEIEEGQDRPAPQGEGEIEGDGIPRTGGSNETDSDTSTSDESGTSDSGSTTGGSTSGGTSSEGPVENQDPQVPPVQPENDPSENDDSGTVTQPETEE